MKPKSKRSDFLRLAVSATMLFCTGDAFAHSNFLKTDGQQIRNQNGKGDLVYLRGANLGGWQLHEGWMSPLKGAADDYNMRKTLSRRFGDNGRDALINAYQDSWLQEKDFKFMSDMGMSAVRLPIYYLNHMNENGQWRRDTAGNIDFTRIQWAVDMARKYRMYVILDLHGAPGSQNGADHSGRVGGADLYGNANYQSQVLEFWKQLAQRFKDDATVAGYDVLNEPSTNFPGPSNSTVWGMYDRIYKTIRAVDPNHIIFLEGIWDWGAIPHPAQYGWTNVVYEFHYYNWGNDRNYQAQANFVESKIAQEQQYRNFKVPHYAGEFTFFALPSSWEYGLRRFNEAGWHWTSWTYKGTNVGNWALVNHRNAASATPDLNNDGYAAIESKWRSWDLDKDMAVNTALVSVFKTALTGNNSLIRNVGYEGSWKANQRMAASNFYNQSGITFDTNQISKLDEGDWVRYIDVDFAQGMNRLKINLAADPAYAGKTIELRLDCRTGPMIGAVKVDSTGGWSKFADTLVNIQQTSGVHDLYLIPKGGQNVANVAWFQFENSTGGGTGGGLGNAITGPGSCNVQTPLSNGGVYRITAKHSGKALDVSGPSTQNGARVHQWTYGGGANQKWAAVNRGNGNWQLRSLYSGKCLDVAGPSQNNGARFHQWDCHNGPSQQFKVQHMGGADYHLRVQHSGKCVDVSEAGTQNGARVHQWDCLGQNNAKWQFQLVQ